jgi:hypothetical protein
LIGWGLVAHVCNPSYSGGRDQEDCSLKPAQANSLKDTILKKPFTKKRARGVGPEFKSQHHTHKKNSKKMEMSQGNPLCSYLKQRKMSFFSFTKSENRRVEQVLPEGSLVPVVAGRM